MDAAKQKKPVFGQALRTAGLLLMSLLAGTAFYVAVILGEPQEIEQVVRPLEDQPLLLASPAINVAEESQLYALLNAFPVPVMHPLSGSGLTFLTGTSYDTAFESGFARIVTLKYESAAGQEMTVESIYPARALSLMGKKDYHLSGVAGQSLAGMRSVRMENDDFIRLHAQAEEALYVVTVPKMESSDLIALTRSLQLFEGE